MPGASVPGGSVPGGSGPGGAGLSGGSLVRSGWRPGALRVLDPSCGDGRFLLGARARWGSAVDLFGVDLDDNAVAVARLAVPDADITHADALEWGWPEAPFDVVVGNPPFLGQMASRTSRGGRSALGGGAYADTAALFLALSARLVRPDGGVVALVLPQSILATRDAGPIRAAIAAEAALTDLWVAGESVFEAAVHTIVAVFQRGRPQHDVRRWFGPDFERVADLSLPGLPGSLVPEVARADGALADGALADGALAEVARADGALAEVALADGALADAALAEVARAEVARAEAVLPGLELPVLDPGPLGGWSSWSFLTADLAGVPAVHPATAGTLGDMASITADFRDQYYGLVGAVSDDANGPPLITTGLIDAGVCHWGQRPTRFAKQRFGRPRVEIAALSPALQRWAATRLVPKVLMATQTKVIEAIADPDGAFLPSVPVLTIVPDLSDDLWRVLAVLLAPSTSAWAASRYLGAGMTSTALKLSATQVRTLPLPAQPWDDAIAPLRAGDWPLFAVAMNRAYAVPDEPVTAWWLAQI